MVSNYILNRFYSNTSWNLYTFDNVLLIFVVCFFFLILTFLSSILWFPDLSISQFGGYFMIKQLIGIICDMILILPSLSWTCLIFVIVYFFYANIRTTTSFPVLLVQRSTYWVSGKLIPSNINPLGSPVTSILHATYFHFVPLHNLLKQVVLWCDRLPVVKTSVRVVPLWLKDTD